MIVMTSPQLVLAPFQSLCRLLRALLESQFRWEWGWGGRGGGDKPGHQLSVMRTRKQDIPASKPRGGNSPSCLGMGHFRVREAVTFDMVNRVLSDEYTFRSWRR